MNRSITLLVLSAFLLVFCHSEQHTETKVISLLETSESWNGVALPDYPEGKPRITVLRVVIPPKTQLPMHKHSGISAGVVLKGELAITTDSGETLRLQAGDAVSEVVDTWHYGTNSGIEPAEVIVFYAGTEDGPITVPKDSKENGPKTPGGSSFEVDGAGDELPATTARPL